MIKRAALNFGLKVLGGGVGIRATALASRNLTSVDYGTLAALLSYCSLVGGLTAFGGDHFFKKYFGERSFESISPVLVIMVFTQIAVIACIFGFLSRIWAGGVSNSIQVVLLCTLLIFCTAGQRSCGGSLIGMGYANFEAFLTALIRPAMVVSVLLTFIFGVIPVSESFGIIDVLIAQLAGFLLALMLAVVIIFNSIRSKRSTEYGSSINYHGLRGYLRYVRESVPMTIVGANGLIERNIDTLMLASLSGAENAGTYFIVTRVSVLAMMPLQALNATNTRKISQILRTNDSHRLKIVCKKMSVYSAGVVSIVLIVAAFKGSVLLVYFGEQYQHALFPLLLLLFSWLLRSMMGPVNLVAVLANYSDRAAKTASVSLVANFALNVILIPAFGIYGAIISTVVTRLGRTLFLSFFLQRKLGVKVGIL